MKQYSKIDEEGYYIEPVIVNPEIVNGESVYNVPDNLIETPFKDGMYKPRWNGAEWVDEITEEELQAIKDEALEQAKIQPPSVDEISMKMKAMENVMNDLVQKFITADNLTQEQKDEIISQYRVIALGDTVYPDEVVNIGGKLFKMVQPSAITIHDENWLQEGSIFAPFLQSEIDDTPVVQEFKQPLGAHDAYQTGDMVLFNDKVYQAVMDNVTWSPADYPQAWELKE